MQFLLDHCVNFMEHVKNKQGSWRKKSHVNWINGCGVMI
jgi:hypothetical protein